MKNNKLIILIVALIVLTSLFNLFFLNNRRVSNVPGNVATSTVATTTNTVATTTPVVIPATVSVKGDITLSVGTKAKVGDVSIKLNSFVQDSRCPIDVNCIQAGAVNVNVTLTDSVHSITKNFPSDEVPYRFGSYNISIVSVAPARESKKEISENQYKVTFHVETVKSVVDKSNLIRVYSPIANTEVSSPLTITGEARGMWFFEATFPVYLTDWDGKIIAQGLATAQKEWTTTNFVPFVATLTFNPADISGGYSKTGTLVFKKDNPSGLPKNDDALEIPVIFK